MGMFGALYFGLVPGHWVPYWVGMDTNLVTHAVDGCLILPQLGMHARKTPGRRKDEQEITSWKSHPPCQESISISRLWPHTAQCVPPCHLMVHHLCNPFPTALFFAPKACYTSLPGSWLSQISRFWGLGVDELCGTSSQVSTRKKGEKRVRCRSSPATSREIHSKYLKRSEKKTSCLFIFWTSMYVIMYMFFVVSDCGVRWNGGVLARVSCHV